MIQQRSTVILVLVALMASACGLGMDTQSRLDRGQKALSEGEYRAAVIDAKNVLLDEPNNSDARLLLGRASVEIGDGVSAEKELRKAIELGVDASGVLVDLGRAMLLQNKFEEIIAQIDPGEATIRADRLAAMRIRGQAMIGLQQPISAREIFAEIIAIDADDIAAQLGVVKSYIAESNFLQARETLNQVLTFDGNHIPTLFLSGALSLQMNNPTRAAADFERAVELTRAQDDNKSEFQALVGLVDALFAQEKPNDARVVLMRMTEIAPDNVATFLVTARLAIVDEDWPKAQENLQEILRRAPDFRLAQMLLGVVQKQSGNLGQAEMYLAAVVSASPENPVARRLLAETRLALNKQESARQVLEPLTRGTDADVVALSLSAVANLRLGNFDEAIELLERGVDTDPGNVDVRVQLALAYFRGGQPSKAQQVLDSLPDMSDQRSEFQSEILGVLTQLAQGDQSEALRLAKELREDWRGRAETHSLVGAIEFAAGDLEAARISFAEGLKVAPDDVEIIRYLAQLDVVDDNPRAAQDRYLLILDLKPNDTFAMISLARLEALSEKNDSATEWLEKARAADLGSANARSILAVRYLESGEFSLAEEIAKEAVALRPDSAELHNYLGIAQHQSENYREAIFSFDRAAELAPDEPSYRFNLAKSQVANGNVASAEMSLQDSIDQTLQHVPSSILLASIKAQSGDFEGAQKIARRLREIHPNEVGTYVLEAELLARQGKLQSAATAYDKALDIEMTEQIVVRAYQIRRRIGTDDQVKPLVRFLEARPLDNKIRNYLANAYGSMGDIGKANTQYELVLAQEPDNIAAINNLAWNYATSGDVRAEELARRAYDLAPDNSSVVDTLGWILVKQGSFEEGIAILRNAAELSSGRAEIRFHLASGLAEAGQVIEAKAILRELLESDEVFSSRQEAEGVLNSL